MPLVEIKVFEGELSKAQTKEVIQEITDVMVSFSGDPSFRHCNSCLFRAETKQREAILRLLRGTSSHPAADHIYEEVRKEIQY